jgi:hypothetical protein
MIRDINDIIISYLLNNIFTSSRINDTNARYIYDLLSTIYLQAVATMNIEKNTILYDQRYK